MDLFPHLTRGGGEVAEGRQSPQGPKLTAPVPCPNSWFSLLGNGGFWGLSGKASTSGLPSQILLFPCSLPVSFRNLIDAGHGREGHPILSLNAQISQTSDWK